MPMLTNTGPNADDQTGSEEQTGAAGAEGGADAGGGEEVASFDTSTVVDDGGAAPMTRAFLDTLGDTTDTPLKAAPAAQAPKTAAAAEDLTGAAKPAAKADANALPMAKPSDATTAKPVEAKPAEAQAAADAPITDLDKEEADVLAEVKSPRGQERLKKVFGTLREKDGALKAANTDIEEFRGMVLNTGSTPQQFAQTLEFSRLVNSGKPEDARVALGMIEQVRGDLAQRLGLDLPGVDHLKDFPDLAEQVATLEITKPAAIEIAKARRVETQRQQSQQMQADSVRDTEAFKQQVTQIGASMETYLNSREGEQDHGGKVAAIVQHFQNPEKMNEFVTTYRPEQWMGAIKFMYDNARPVGQTAPAQQTQQTQQRAGGYQTIRASGATPAAPGTPQRTGATPLARVSSFIDTL